MYRNCGVPNCNTKGPSKIYFILPKNKDVRNAWLKAAKRDLVKYPLSRSSRVYFCQDHFNIEEDTDNFIRWKWHSDVRLSLKRGAVPSIFTCQDVKTMEENVLAFKLHSKGDAGLDHTYCLEPKESSLVALVLENKGVEPLEILNFAADKSIANIELNVFNNNLSTSVMLMNDPMIKNDIQVDITPQRRTLNIQTKDANLITSAPSSAKRKLDKAASSFMKLPKLTPSLEVSEESPCSPVLSVNKGSDDCIEPTKVKYSLISPENSVVTVTNDKLKEILKLRKESSLVIIKKYSNHYIGVPREAYFLIKVLEEKIPTDVINILITLKKMRLNDSFVSLGHDFNLHCSIVSRIFINTIRLMSKHLRAIISVPDKLQIQQSLPLAFEGFYCNTCSIINCLEIYIKEPNNALDKTLTWSKYRNANIIKYLISSTPCGSVSFVSKGYGGRATDEHIIQDSGYLATLPNEGVVMADRGFKRLYAQLSSYNCTLLMLPSVPKDMNMTNREVQPTKRIVTPKILIEQVMQSIREFKILSAQSELDRYLLSVADHMVVVACALINLQPCIK